VSGAEQERSAGVRTASTCRPHSAATQHPLGLGRSTLLFACEHSKPVRSIPQAGVGAPAEPSVVHTSTALVSSSHRWQQTAGRSDLPGILVSYFAMVQR